MLGWLRLYHPPQRHAGITAGESQRINPASEPGAIGHASHWRAALGRSETWLLMFSRTVTDPVWYFYLFWFPKYLTDVRQLSLLEMGKVAWAVYLGADLGCLVGGWLSGRLILRDWRAPLARQRILTMAACMVPLSLAIPIAASPYLAVMLAGVVAFAHLSWQVTLTALVVDIFPGHLLGTVFGLVAAGSGLGGMLSTNLVGQIVTAWSYTPLFVAMACLHPLALLALVRPAVRRSLTRPDPAGG